MTTHTSAPPSTSPPRTTAPVPVGRRPYSGAVLDRARTLLPVLARARLAARG